MTERFALELAIVASSFPLGLVLPVARTRKGKYK